MSYSSSFYLDSVFPRLQKTLGLANVMSVPRISKITLNMGLNTTNNKKQDLINHLQDLQAISGQKPVITTCRKAIAGFKIREGFPIGVKVTMRKKNMYNFLDKFINVVLPRVRDFNGIPHYSFDVMGNLNIGIKDHTCFPEIDFDKVSQPRGLDVCITTTARDETSCKALIEAFNIPLNYSVKKPKARPRRYFGK